MILFTLFMIALLIITVVLVLVVGIGGTASGLGWWLLRKPKQNVPDTADALGLQHSDTFIQKHPPGDAIKPSD